MSVDSKGGTRQRPRSFVDDWSAPGTPAPPTTLANPLDGMVAAERAFEPRSIGPRFSRVAIADLVGAPFVEFGFWGGLDVSPDGREVAFSWNRSGVNQIYVAPLDGTRIYELTTGSERSVWPRWSPDGSQLAFLSDRAGDEKFAIWVVDRDGHRARALTDEPGVAHRDIDWSPDGTKLACVANRGRSYGIEVIDVASGSRSTITDGSHDDAAPRWSPDGRWLVFHSARDAKVKTNFDLYLIGATGGTPTRLETRDGKDGESIEARWSPDGRSIAFTTNARGRYEIALAELDNAGAPRRVRTLTSSNYDSREPYWRRDGRGVIYLRSRESRASVRRVFAPSHADSALDDTPGVHASARTTGRGETVVSAFSSATRPWDIWVREEGSIAPRPITASLSERVDPRTLVEPIHVWYPGIDGRQIPALVYVPYAEALAGPGLPPAIVYIHGGPTGQHFVWWDATAQFFANRGYVVLAPNIRGSTGYGREFQEANRGDWGGSDLEDVLAGIDWLEREKVADAKRVAAYGGSYGGFMTLLALAMTPERWAAGCSVVGVVSWRTLFDTTRGDLREYLLRELGDPERSPDLYRARSPITHVTRIRSPLLVLQGANDPRVPLSEANAVIEALKRSGTTFDYHVYPDEGHGFRLTENRIDALRRAGEWFDQHLKAPEAKTS